MIEHKKTGYLATPYDADDLVNGMVWALENAGETLSAEVRRQAEIRHAPAARVNDYLDVYKGLLQK